LLIAQGVDLAGRIEAETDDHQDGDGEEDGEVSDGRAGQGWQLAGMRRRR
jgi:hypothetical protein